MYTLSENQLLTINKGDTFSLPIIISIYQEDSPYVKRRYQIEDDDVITFKVTLPESTVEDEKVVLTKILGKEDVDIKTKDLRINFEHEDTKDLDAGTYYYELKIKRIKDGKEVFDTIIQRRKFTVLE